MSKHTRFVHTDWEWFTSIKELSAWLDSLIGTNTQVGEENITEILNVSTFTIHGEEHSYYDAIVMVQTEDV